MSLGKAIAEFQAVQFMLADMAMQLEAARKRCEAQAAELAALRAEHEPLVARLQALRTVLRALLARLSPAARHTARSRLQETGFIEWLDAD